MSEIVRSAAPLEDEPDLAEVIVRREGCVVRLPSRYARAALEEMLKTGRVTGRVVMGPADIRGFGSLGPEQWAVITPPHLQCAQFVTARPPGILTSNLGQTSHVFVFPKHTVVLPQHQARWLQCALERVKPERLDAKGRPLPWTSPRRAPAQRPAQQRDQDADLELVVVDHGEPLPAVAAEAADADAVISTQQIHRIYRALCERLDISPAALVVRRGKADRRGLVLGRVWLTREQVALRISITTCPNSDEAEIVATLLHELAHVVSRSQPQTAHGPAFRETLVALASRAFGAPYLAAARAHITESYAVVDRWVGSGIRAALAQDEPSVARSGDDGHTARIIGKIAKLRALASDQIGKPEAIAATAKANDLVTCYGLGAYDIEFDPGIHDGLVDRWVLLERGKPWQRALAHAVARFNGVFSLELRSRARMHLFGRYPNVVAAEYLYTISAERIRRDRDTHLKAWRTSAAPRARSTRQESVAFCDSAVRAFERKLERAAISMGASSADDDADAPTSTDLGEAEQFARDEHEKRGMSWGSGPKRKARHSDAGEEAGSKLPIVRGLDSNGQPPRSLGDGALRPVPPWH